MVHPYDFANWYVELVIDAVQRGCAGRMRIRAESFWHDVYAHGLPPRVDAVLAWAEGDVESFFARVVLPPAKPQASVSRH